MLLSGEGQGDGRDQGWGENDGRGVVDRPTQLICISDIYLLTDNNQMQKT